jgi:hypothetical protein
MIRGEGNDDKCNNVRLIRLMKRWSSSIHPSCSLTCAAEHRVGMKPDMSRGMPNWDSTVINGQNHSHVMFSVVAQSEVLIRKASIVLLYHNNVQMKTELHLMLQSNDKLLRCKLLEWIQN